MWRRVRADGIARRQTRLPAHQAAISRRCWLYGCPTIINNVETLSAVPAIIREGGEAYANRGTPKNGGTRLLCVAGRVRKPGIYEIPLGMNMKKFIYEVAGGVPVGKKLKAVIPGG